MSAIKVNDVGVFHFLVSFTEDGLHIYTLRQLCGITLIMTLSCLTACRNLCQYQYKSPANIFKASREPLTNFHGRPLPLSCPGQPSFSDVLISPIASKSVWRICVDVIQLWAIVVCKVQYQTKVAIMAINIRLVVNEIIVRLSRLGLSRGWVDVENYPSTTKCYLKVLRRIRESRKSHEQKTMPFSVSRGESVFSQHPGSGCVW